MDKVEAIKQIRAARRAHLSWVMKANALIQGIPLDEDQVPVSSKNCKFGRWYHAAGQDFRKITGFNEINGPHEELHAIYHQIFNLLIPEEQSGLIQKLLGSKPKVSDKNLKKARELFQSLKSQSEKVVEKLDFLEQNIEKEA